MTSSWLLLRLKNLSVKKHVKSNLKLSFPEKFVTNDSRRAKSNIDYYLGTNPPSNIFEYIGQRDFEDEDDLPLIRLTKRISEFHDSDCDSESEYSVDADDSFDSDASMWYG